MTGKIQSLTKEKIDQLASKEQELLRIIARASDLGQKGDAMRELGEFYLFQMKNRSKVSEIISKLDHDRAYILKVQLVDSDDSMSPLQKVSAYKELLKEYPEHEESLNFSIKVRTQESTNAKNS